MSESFTHCVGHSLWCPLAFAMQSFYFHTLLFQSFRPQLICVVALSRARSYNKRLGPFWIGRCTEWMVTISFIFWCLNIFCPPEAFVEEAVFLHCVSLKPLSISDGFSCVLLLAPLFYSMNLFACVVSKMLFQLWLCNIIWNKTLCSNSISFSAQDHLHYPGSFVIPYGF